MMWRKIGFIDLLVFALLLFIGVALLRSHDIMNSVDSVATLVGALFGGAALLLGNWINRWNEYRETCKDLEERVVYQFEKSGD